jgi:hypothetical protein
MQRWGVNSKLSLEVLALMAVSWVRSSGGDLRLWAGEVQASRPRGAIAH